METLTLRNRYLEERLRCVESQIPKEPPSRASAKNVSSRPSRGIHSVTFDVLDGSCEGNAAPPPAESSCRPVFSEAGEDSAEQQVAGETRTGFGGADDACAEREPLSPDVAGTAEPTGEQDADADCVQEDEADILEMTRDVSFEEEEETLTTKGSESEPEDPSGRPGSAVSSSEPAATATGAETAHKEGVGERDDPVGSGEEKPEQAELNDEVVETTKGATEEGNPEQSRSAEPDVDSGSIPSKLPERVVGEKRDAHVRKRESRSLRYLKTSGRGTGTPSQRDQDFQKENLKLASENLELRFQLEQTNKDVPRLKNQVADLKEMCSALKKEKAEVEKKLSHIRGAGHSGKTVPELERTVGLMKKVVERVQRENETLKKSAAPANQEKFTALEQEHEKLKGDYEKLKGQSEAELTSKLESKTKGLERIVVENERLRKEMKREMEAAQRLRETKASLEVTNEKLEADLEETKQRLQAALSKPITEGVNSKTWKASVVTRMFENKMKELEKELSQKTSSLSELKQQLKETREREERARISNRQLEDQVDMLKSFPIAAKAGGGLTKEFQALRLVNTELEKENTELKQRLNEYSQRYGETSSTLDHAKLKRILHAAEAEKTKLQTEVKKLRKELENFDPTFFEEIEDLKYNYNLEVKKNILLEEQLKKVCDQFGVKAELPNVSVS